MIRENTLSYRNQYGWSGEITVKWPTNLNHKRSYRVGTLRPWMESHDNFNTPDQEELLDGDSYFLTGRSVLLLVEK
ncbi:MAG TPA: hypothetical protein VFG71_08400 [Nitrospiraceae bacterium]|nr:hypothetical protein [Nitrospiraceae bacterium]